MLIKPLVFLLCGAEGTTGMRKKLAEDFHAKVGVSGKRKAFFLLHVFWDCF